MKPINTANATAGLGRRFTLAMGRAVKSCDKHTLAVVGQLPTILMMFSSSLAYFKTGKLMT
jgi:hypothetical protein